MECLQATKSNTNLAKYLQRIQITQMSHLYSGICLVCGIFFSVSVSLNLCWYHHEKSIWREMDIHRVVIIINLLNFACLVFHYGCSAAFTICYCLAMLYFSNLYSLACYTFVHSSPCTVTISLFFSHFLCYTAFLFSILAAISLLFCDLRSVYYVFLQIKAQVFKSVCIQLGSMQHPKCAQPHLT